MPKQEIELRDISPDYVDFMLRVENDPEVWSYSLLTDAPYSREEIEAFCSEPHSTDQCRKVIMFNDEPAGFIDLYDITPLRASVSIIVYPKELRHIGVGSQALALLEAQAANSYGIKELVVEISPNNTPSLNFFQSCGFTHSHSNIYLKRTYKF